MKEKNRECLVCGKALDRYQKKYCSSHGNGLHKKALKAKPVLLVQGQSTADTGTMCELLVCADLFSKGFSVYRSVSGCAKFDLVAYKDEHLLRVEVKTGRKGENGIVTYARAANTEYDILAVCLPDEGKVIYEPDLN